jgi:hypothetical protein
MKPKAVGLEFEEGICNFYWLHQYRKPTKVCKFAVYVRATLISTQVLMAMRKMSANDLIPSFSNTLAL